MSVLGEITMAFRNLSLNYKYLQESVLSIYKDMQPFSLKKIEYFTPEQRCAEEHLENLKWQQEMFHRILNVMGLHKEGIVSEEKVVATRTELLFALIASPADGECPAITRDKLLFLQELLYAKCISEEDYHLSRRPLLLRLEVQGFEIDSKDVLSRCEPIPCVHDTAKTGIDAMQASPESLSKQETEWTVVKFNEGKEILKNKSTGNNSKKQSPVKQVVNAISPLSLIPYKEGNTKDKHPSIIVPESVDLRSNKKLCLTKNFPTLPIQRGYKELPQCINPTKSFKDNQFSPAAALFDIPEVPVKKKSEESSFLKLLTVSRRDHKRGATRAKVKKALNQVLLKVHKDHSKESQSGASYSFTDSDSDTDEQHLKPEKRTWIADLLMSLKSNKSEEEMAYIPLSGAASEEAVSPSKLTLKPIGEGPNTKKIKKKIHPDGAATDFFIDKVLGENIKTELSRICAEMSGTNSNPSFTDEQIEDIAIRLPVDKNELKKVFPKSWCDRYGDVVLNVVQKEFKHHVGEMENLRKVAQERRNNAARRWVLENHDMKCSPKTDKARGQTHRKLSGDILNRLFTTQDENSDPANIGSFSSAFTGQQLKSPLHFHS